MASYEQHAQAASDLLASMKLGKLASYEDRARAAQVEALLALAAAIAGRQTGSSLQPPQSER
ncbi:hypothetical protein SGFS_064620 [Streptomyces graminofaciens]|uniref:Uncharacterized protein n=1 Tax=Streptomyces graminofaciens TaxID=68212 RepID=A0ABM7FG53_9ACTN|nr:hypothetical protein [Streptomyces graminofaciens]BBC35168.1 hypothetical protein SGFS_064620 [Streptomyces graminofaciens]